MKVKLLRKIRKRFTWKFKQSFVVKEQDQFDTVQQYIDHDVAHNDWLMEPEIHVADHLNIRVDGFTSIKEFIALATYCVTDRYSLVEKWRAKNYQRQRRVKYRQFIKS